MQVQETVIVWNVRQCDSAQLQETVPTWSVRQYGSNQLQERCEYVA